MSLLWFEFKKFAIKPYVLMLLIACTLVNLIGAYFSCAYYQKIYDHVNFQKMYNTALKGELTEDKVNFVISETNRLNELIADQTASHETDPNTYTGNVYADSYLFMYDIYPEVKYAVSYYYNNQKIVEKAKNNIIFFTEIKNHYELSKNEQIVAKYGSRMIKNFYDLKGLKYFIYYDFSALIILLICLLIVVPVFVSERETKMDHLLPSFKKGSSRLVWTKILFTFAVVFLISLWFSVWDVIGFSVFTPLHGFDAPIFALKDFQFTPLNLKIFQYLLMSFALKTTGVGTLLSLVLLASHAFKKNIYAFVVSAGVILIPFLSQFMAKDSFRIHELINPALLIKNRFLFMDYSVQNVLGYPVSSAVLALAANLIVTLLDIILIVLFSENRFSFKPKNTKAKP